MLTNCEKNFAKPYNISEEVVSCAGTYLLT